MSNRRTQFEPKRQTARYSTTDVHLQEVGSSRDPFHLQHRSQQALLPEKEKKSVESQTDGGRMRKREE